MMLKSSITNSTVKMINSSGRSISL